MRKLILAICVFVGAPSISHAGPITVGDFQGVAVGYISPFNTEAQFAILGSSTMTNGSGISPAIDGLTFEAYCVDILGDFFLPDPPEPFDATAGSMQAWDLYGTEEHQVTAGSYAAYLYNSNAETIRLADDNVGRTAL